MEDKVNYAVVGAFVLILGAALIMGVLWLGSGRSYRTTYDTYLTYMNESVSGLNLNAPVRYRGVEVGRVQRIRLAPGNVEQVQLTLVIEHGTPIKADTVAILQTQGLTGLAFIELNGGSRDSPAPKKQEGEDYPVIPSAPSLLTRLDSAVTALLANLNRASEHFNTLMDDNNQSTIKTALADIALVSHTLAARADTIDSSLNNAAHLMQSMAQLSDELRQLVQRAQRSADAFDQMSGTIASAGANASRTLDGTRQFTDEALPEAHQLFIELRQLTDSLQRISAELEQNPGVLLHGKPAARRGPGE
ncbi:MlaD family protein [Ferrigenium sp. UT4]